MHNSLRVKIEIPQEKNKPWKVAAVHPGKAIRLSNKRTAISCYRFAENRIKKFFKVPRNINANIVRPVFRGGKTVVYIKDGIYHNDGEYTDFKSTLFALTAFLEDHLKRSFVYTRLIKYLPE